MLKSKLLSAYSMTYLVHVLFAVSWSCNHVCPCMYCINVDTVWYAWDSAVGHGWLGESTSNYHLYDENLHIYTKHTCILIAVSCIHVGYMACPDLAVQAAQWYSETQNTGKNSYSCHMYSFVPEDLSWKICLLYTVACTQTTPVVFLVKKLRRIQNEGNPTGWLLPSQKY